MKSGLSFRILRWQSSVAMQFLLAKDTSPIEGSNSSHLKRFESKPWSSSTDLFFSISKEK